jgi:hypothetical protein
MFKQAHFILCNRTVVLLFTAVLKSFREHLGFYERRILMVLTTVYGIRIIYYQFIGGLIPNCHKVTLP